MVEAVGAWGARWIGEIGERDLDPKLLLWDMHRNVVLSEVPGAPHRAALPVPRDRRPAVAVVAGDQPGRAWTCATTTRSTTWTSP